MPAVARPSLAKCSVIAPLPLKPSGLWLNANVRRKTALARDRANELVKLAQRSGDDTTVVACTITRRCGPHGGGGGRLIWLVVLNAALPLPMRAKDRDIQHTHTHRSAGAHGRCRRGALRCLSSACGRANEKALQSRRQISQGATPRVVEAEAPHCA